jgi:hypothetical protein
LQDLDPESRIKDWLHDASPVHINPDEDTSPGKIFSTKEGFAQRGREGVRSEEGKGRVRSKEERGKVCSEGERGKVR